MLQDLPPILYWYLTITVIGWIFLPLTSRLFRGFFDRGYIFSKILGILLSSYGLWLLASLKILPFFRESIFIILILFLIVNILLTKYLYNRHTIVSRLYKYYYRLFILEEALFLAALLFWSWVRGHEPSIHGLEKFMDFGFINSILRNPYFPLQDMWLAPANDPGYSGGFFINYYYFGHYVTAFLSKLTGLPSEITYNLMLSTLFALTFSGAFSLGANLISQYRSFAISKFRILAGGLFTAFLVTLAGNLHTIYLFTHDYPNEAPIPFWKILKLGLNSNYWYPNATRFIPNTIHEFPSYSWVVADLHGHVLDIPFVLLAIALLLALITKSQAPSTKLQTSTKQRVLRFIWDSGFGIWDLTLLGLVLAVLYMTNAWDGLIYLILTSLILFATLKQRKLKETRSNKQISNVQIANYLSFAYWKFRIDLLISLFAYLLILGISFLLFSLPFNLNFKPFVHGIGVVGGWEIGNTLGLIKDNAPAVIKLGPFLLEKGNNLRSPLWMLAVLWGFFYFNVITFLLYLLRNLKHQAPNSKQNKRFRIWNLFGIWKLGFGILRKVDIFVLLLISLSTFLLIFPEFFYAKDIYPGHYRANTMFKLGYQAFIMLAIASGYIIMRLISKSQAPNSKWNLKNWNLFGIWKLGFGILLMLLLALVAIYPYYAIRSYYGVFGVRKYEGQDGLAWLKTAHPGDYEAVQWLRAEDHPPRGSSSQRIILEAVGESYTDYARISANTGLPTVLGWPVHEWLWRGSYDEPGKRVEEVRQIYEASNPALARSLLKKYNIRYLIIGQLEREKYLNLNEGLLASLGKLVFSSQGTKIYQLYKVVL